jgi:TonB family protein
MIFASPNALASDVKVIANSSVKADMLSAGELKRVFLEEKIALGDGTHVEPVLEKDGPIHEAFLQEYLGRTDDDLRTYYRALVFTGRGSMPRELGSDAEVIAYVARTRGAIGYVSTATSAEGVKTLAIGDTGINAQRRLITRVEPEYPETLKRLSIGGTVRLQVTISARGNVENVELLGGNPILGESAISAVKKWVYATGHSRSVAEESILFDSHP